MFDLRQHVAQIIVREAGESVRIDTVLLWEPASKYDFPLVGLTGSPSRRYNAITGEEVGSADRFMTTRIVRVEL